MKKRLFTAVNLPEATKKELEKILTALPDLPAIKKVPSQNLHFTLNFLGYVEEAKIAEAEEALKINCPKFGQFKISFGEWGVFPNWRRPRVVWLGIDEPSGGLVRLQKTLHQAFLERGFQFDRHASDFSPHLTLARIKGFLPPEILAQIKSFANGKPALEPVAISSVELMESTLGGAAPIYRVVESFKLEGR